MARLAVPPTPSTTTVTIKPVSDRRGIQWRGRTSWWLVEAHDGTSKKPGASHIAATFLTRRAAAEQAARWLEHGWAQ